MMGLSSGVMIAASYWSLLDPALKLATDIKQNAALVASCGFLLGGVFIIVSDIYLEKKISACSCTKSCNSSKLLIFAVTLHNIPEGLAVGVAFGNAGVNPDKSKIIAAIMLAIGIGIQNFPEGSCVSLPLLREGKSRKHCFILGQFSGLVEPIAGILGAMFAIFVESALPIILAFSAGAMVTVVCQELIPDSFKDNKHLSSCGVILGFIIMMVLDVSLG